MNFDRLEKNICDNIYIVKKKKIIRNIVISWEMKM